MQSLVKTNNARVNTNTEKLIVTPQNEQDILELYQRFEHSSSDFKIFISKLKQSRSTNVVVKIGNVEKIQNEYQMWLLVQNTPNFAKFFSVFNCHNNLSNVNTGKPICSENNKPPIAAIVMPYYNLGRIDHYKWTRKNFDVLKSVLKHAACSVLKAYDDSKFVHRDLHLGNILLCKSTLKAIQYTDKTNIECLKLLPVIMDFERGAQSNDIRILYNDIKRMMMLIASELDDMKLDLSHVINALNNMASSSAPVTEHTYTTIYKNIDKIAILYLMSERPKPNFSLPM